ncbi:uncharacterized protein ANIA_11384 [Aspergillus nidulans FGSC A4]|uniref:Uncharacterized protein n=1 Tax=Emericella nidulans (strain FGSC A4 / ATCC 38163 / CBS 112.46 / NRRL 194 / M139) TaxID=227321 RepID=C8VHX9_EMENI|nr:hypothetical protein [Aspergillus nidulans FGSC A4]CBF82962.1 TPA: hypothetical protein ANIA_11384 [Aspergillus nidulans FGSC A4]
MAWDPADLKGLPWPDILATQRVAPPGFGAAKNIQNPMDN